MGLGGWFSGAAAGLLAGGASKGLGNLLPATLLEAQGEIYEIFGELVEQSVDGFVGGFVGEVYLQVVEVKAGEQVCIFGDTEDSFGVYLFVS